VPRSAGVCRLLTTFIQGNPFCILVTEYYGQSEAELQAKIERLATQLQREKIRCTVVPALNPALQNNVWTVRKVGLGLLMSVRGDTKPIPFIEDAAVPVEQLAEYVTGWSSLQRLRHQSNLLWPCQRRLPASASPHQRQAGRRGGQTAAHCLVAMELAGEYGGAISSEHGDGRSRSWLNEKFFGSELYDLYRQVKQTFDPHYLLNPGNIVDAPPMTTALRYDPTYTVIPLKEHLDFSQDQGFHRAVEMCNGAGVCRKRTGGTMCPSFMVTRDEEHSTVAGPMLSAPLSPALSLPRS